MDDGDGMREVVLYYQRQIEMWEWIFGCLFRWKNSKGTSEPKSKEKEPLLCPERRPSFSFKIECSLGWAGNHPCVHGPNEGCMRHNPEKLPIVWNQYIPSDKKGPGIIERWKGPYITPKYKAVQKSRQIWSKLHLDHSTVDPLDPTYALIRYALAFYHMDWVRNASTPELAESRAAALSCYGIRPGDEKRRPDLYYMIRPYWHEGSFLLWQGFGFVFEPFERYPVAGYEKMALGYPLQDWTFRPCPHIKHTIYSYSFTETRGLIRAELKYGSSGNRNMASFKWDSTLGTSRRAFNCKHCATDSWISVELEEGKLVVTTQIWKDLGKAQDAFDPKWIAALRPNAPGLKRSEDDIMTNSVKNIVVEAAEVANQKLEESEA
ncbi:hypothetical protein M426DRAFT_320833 [Hypoxylon sp. CI-4A]|nr:hypothetical protein M426DRAFT_320833 [Hypoxylon sp. CI-4A]